jgi:hypothetical protein
MPQILREPSSNLQGRVRNELLEGPLNLGTPRRIESLELADGEGPSLRRRIREERDDRDGRFVRAATRHALRERHANRRHRVAKEQVARLWREDGTVETHDRAPNGRIGVPRETIELVLDRIGELPEDHERLPAHSWIPIREEIDEERLPPFRGIGGPPRSESRDGLAAQEVVGGSSHPFEEGEDPFPSDMTRGLEEVVPDEDRDLGICDRVLEDREGGLPDPDDRLHGFLLEGRPLLQEFDRLAYAPLDGRGTFLDRRSLLRSAPQAVAQRRDP